MEITEIETILRSDPIPENETWRLGGLGDDEGRKGVKADMVILRVHTDEGLTGLGEPTPYAGATELREAVERLKPSVIGADPFDVDRLGYRSDTAYFGGRERYALAGIDMACWDLMGKAAGRPVRDLLGGRHADRVPVYASGGIDWRFLDDPDRLVAEAERYLAAGYDAFKFRIGPDDRFLDAMERLDEAVGDRMELIVEGNARFDSVADAVRMAERFPFEPRWFEEPVDTTDRAAYRELRRALPGIRITGGESKESPAAFKPWIDERAYDVVQPDCNVLGITAAKRVADIARVEGIPCVPHNWHNAIATAANLHLAASIGNREVLERQCTSHWSRPAFREEILAEPLVPEDGHLRVPDAPGLGVELDEDALDDYPYEPGPVEEPWDGP